MITTLASSIAGYISVGCWLVVFTPQLYENYQRKSTQGLSLHFILIWLLADVFSVAGAIINHLLWTIIVLGIYYAVVEVILLGQMYLYRTAKVAHSASANEQEVNISPPSPSSQISPFSNAVASALVAGDAEATPNERTPLISSSTDTTKLFALTSFALISIWSRAASNPSVIRGGRIVTGTSSVSSLSPAPEMARLGDILGYLSAALYIGARIPQIYHNFRHKSCEGLSMLMFVFCVLGNTTFCLSILLQSTLPEWLYVNIPWFLGSAGTMVLDFVVLFQFYVYRHASPLRLPDETV
ncbi:PQ loop repeat-domain-containing protein [Gaertneriomyces semiglobifer]|nr:PQ loop repeat-domain-containing protein [Gaertneriomyces semiglobifer]